MSGSSTQHSDQPRSTELLKTNYGVSTSTGGEDISELADKPFDCIAQTPSSHRSPRPSPPLRRVSEPMSSRSRLPIGLPERPKLRNQRGSPLSDVKSSPPQDFTLLYPISESYHSGSVHARRSSSSHDSNMLQTPLHLPSWHPGHQQPEQYTQNTHSRVLVPRSHQWDGSTSQSPESQAREFQQEGEAQRETTIPKRKRSARIKAALKDLFERKPDDKDECEQETRRIRTGHWTEQE